MKRLLCATALSCILSALCVSGAIANDTTMKKSATETALIKASYVLPKEDGQDFRQTLHEADEENRGINQQIALNHADLYDIMIAPDFDSKAFTSKLAETHKLEAQAKENRDEALASAVAALSLEERRSYADALESNPKYLHGGHHHKKMAGHNTDNLQDASPSAGNEDAVQ